MAGRLGAAGGTAGISGEGAGVIAGADAGTGTASRVAAAGVADGAGDGSDCAAIATGDGCGVGAGPLTSGEGAGAFSDGMDGAAGMASPDAMAGDDGCGVLVDRCGCSVGTAGGGGFSGCIEDAGGGTGIANGLPSTDAIMLLSTLTRASSAVNMTKLSFSDATVPFIIVPFFKVMEMDAPMLKRPAGTGAAAV